MSLLLMDYISGAATVLSLLLERVKINKADYNLC